jgi:hypothetical protein
MEIIGQQVMFFFKLDAVLFFPQHGRAKVFLGPPLLTPALLTLIEE